MAPITTARKNHAMAMLDGKLYAAGGEREADEAPDNSVERYDLETKAWEAVAPMATARISHAMTVLDSRMYTVGGHTNDYEGLLSYLTSVERYDPATNAWEAVAPMATARCTFAVAVLDGKLYAVGGYNLDDGNLSSVERYDPALDVWEAVAPMAVRRIAFGVAVLGGKLYAVGGQFVAGGEVRPRDKRVGDDGTDANGSALVRRGGAGRQAVCCRRRDAIGRPPAQGGRAI